MEMIDRVQEAIKRRATDRGHSIHPAVIRHLAAAAIEAMREPTDAMASSPMATCYNSGPYGDKEVRRIWGAMIDAALAAPTQVGAA
jgi:hypothetical protein